MNIWTTTKTSQVLISKRFQRIIALHILKNNLKKTDTQVPLLLGIHGPSGEGKTFQCENALRKMGVKRFLISGGQLEDPKIGEPAQMIRSTYIKASDSMKSGESSLAVVLVNDIDTGLGRVGESVQFTINQRTVFGELMHLVDYPKAVEGRDTVRVPIVITGNDFTKLYEPLVRAGRMEAFEWIPTIDERVDIVGSIFPELTREEIQRLILELTAELKDEMPTVHKVLPIAFYAHLRSNLLDEDLWEVIENTGLQKTIDKILKGDEPDFSLGIYYDRVLAKGIELARSGTLINHILTSRG